MSDLQLLNGWASALCAVVFAAMVLSSRVKDGVVVKSGLILAIAGSVVTFMLTIEQSRFWDAYALANLMFRGGLIVAVGGVAYRMRKRAIGSKKKSEAHSQRTNQLLAGMTHPANDLMDLLIDTREKEKQ